MTWKNIILERVYANDNNNFAKNMVVVPIQSKEEGNVAAGMIEALKKCMEIWSWCVQMT